MQGISPNRGPSLRLIRGAHDADDWPRFSGGSALPERDELEPSLERACGSYGMGLLLETRLDAFPSHDEAFLVIDSRLTVQALSGEAATLLGVVEEDVLDSPVAQLLGPADTEAREPEDFLYLLRRASTDSDERHSVFVRPRNQFGVRLVARIAPCGPPRGALVLLRTRALQVEIRRGALR